MIVLRPKISMDENQTLIIKKIRRHTSSLLALDATEFIVFFSFFDVLKKIRIFSKDKFNIFY